MELRRDKERLDDDWSREELMQAIDRARISLGELLAHGSPVPDGQGNAIPFEANPEDAQETLRLLNKICSIDGDETPEG